MERAFGAIDAISGSIEVPGDKAIAHRALILGAMMMGTSNLHGFPKGKAVGSTRHCLATLGFDIRDGDNLVEVVGAGWQTPDFATLDAGNSATSMRLLCGALAGRPGRFELTGDQYLLRRPMERVAEPLRKMGGKVSTSDGRPPVIVEGGPLAGADHDLEIASAQVKTAILFCGLQADGITRVKEPTRSRDHTERLLRWLGARITTGTREVTVEGDPLFFEKSGFSLEIPGDFSSAAFFITAACLVGKSDLEIRGVGLNPTRTGLLDALREMGASVEYQLTAEDVEPLGVVSVRTSPLHGAEIAGDLIPRSIDEVPLVALAATQAEGQTVIKDAAELRVKESDRLDVMAKGLIALGARIDTQPDGLVIEGPTKLHGGLVNAAGDHRMALLFALAGCIASEPVTVSGWECVSVSYPDFETDLERLAAS